MLWELTLRIQVLDSIKITEYKNRSPILWEERLAHILINQKTLALQGQASTTQAQDHSQPQQQIAGLELKREQ